MWFDEKCNFFSLDSSAISSFNLTKEWINFHHGKVDSFLYAPFSRRDKLFDLELKDLKQNMEILANFSSTLTLFVKSTDLDIFTHTEMEINILNWYRIIFRKFVVFSTVCTFKIFIHQSQKFNYPNCQFLTSKD